MLAADSALTPAELESARAEAAARRADLERAQVDLRESRIQAPFAGTLGRVRVVVGQVVAPGTERTTLTDLDTLEIEIGVPERYLAELAGDLQWIDEDLTPSAGGVASALRQSWPAFLELEQPLCGSGAVIADARAGAATLRPGWVRRDVARAAIILDVEARFWSVVMARDVLAVEREVLMVLEEAVRLEKARAASGAATPLDLVQAKTATANRGSAVLGAKRDLRIIWEQFLAALGAPPDPPQGPERPDRAGRRADCQARRGDTSRGTPARGVSRTLTAASDCGRGRSRPGPSPRRRR